MDKAWQQIKDGFKAYEVLPRTSEEDALYQQMLKYWEEWQQEDQELLRINQEFETVGILNPLGLQLNLINQGSGQFYNCWFLRIYECVERNGVVF